MKPFTSHALAFIVGAVVGVVGTHALLGDRESRDMTGDVTVRQVSGERIAHHDVTVGRNAITFRTTAEGKGEALTEIPKRLVPERVNGWTSVNAFQLTAALESIMDFPGEWRDVLRRIGRFP
jgi:hypothetical protein